MQERGSLRVLRFGSKRKLIAWTGRIGTAYNKAFSNNWEYYPLTEREISFLVDTLMLIANPRLFKLIAHGDDVVGFLFAFADVSAALQRARGHLFPLGLPDLLLEMRRTRWVALNGMGILPEFQGRGGNTLLYSEMEKTMRESGFEHADSRDSSPEAAGLARHRRAAVQESPSLHGSFDRQKSQRLAHPSREERGFVTS